MLAEVIHRVIQINGHGPFVWWPLILLVVGGLIMITTMYTDGIGLFSIATCAFIVGFIFLIILQTTVKVSQDQIQVTTGAHKFWVNAHKLEDGTWWPDK